MSVWVCVCLYFNFLSAFECLSNCLLGKENADWKSKGKKTDTKKQTLLLEHIHTQTLIEIKLKHNKSGGRNFPSNINVENQEIKEKEEEEEEEKNLQNKRKEMKKKIQWRICCYCCLV